MPFRRDQLERVARVVRRHLPRLREIGRRLEVLVDPGQPFVMGSDAHVGNAGREVRRDHGRIAEITMTSCPPRRGCSAAGSAARASRAPSQRAAETVRAELACGCDEAPAGHSQRRRRIRFEPRRRSIRFDFARRHATFSRRMLHSRWPACNVRLIKPCIAQMRDQVMRRPRKSAGCRRCGTDRTCVTRHSPKGSGLLIEGQTRGLPAGGHRACDSNELRRSPRTRQQLAPELIGNSGAFRASLSPPETVFRSGRAGQRLRYHGWNDIHNDPVVNVAGKPRISARAQIKNAS